MKGKAILMIALFSTTAAAKGPSAIMFGKRELTIKAKSQGELVDMKVEEGDAVKATAPIAIIDDRQEKIDKDLAFNELRVAKKRS